MITKTVLILLGIIAGAVGISSASQITLDPSSLPSRQGWDYSVANLHAGTVETDIFSTDGSLLNMNSMDQPIHWLTGGGAVLYRQSNVVSSAMPTTLECTSRMLDYEPVPSPGENHGFVAGFPDGSLEYRAAISLSQIALFDGSGFKYIALDATEYHTYRIETVSGSSANNFYIDDIQQASASARFVSGANYL